MDGYSMTSGGNNSDSDEMMSHGQSETMGEDYDTTPDGAAPPRQPHIEILELKETSIKFLLTRTDYAFANSLRRVMIAEVPTLAIDLVEMIANSSVLNDEFMSHRLGLVPLTSSEVQKFKTRQNCDCNQTNGCEKCTVVFRLEVKNTSDESINVTSQDLIGDENSSCQAVDFSKTGEENILLVKLGKNQGIHARCIATKGIAKEHAKWQPCSISAFQYDPEIVLDHDIINLLEPEDKARFAASCPTKVYEYNEHKDQISVVNRQACTYCQECVYVAEEVQQPDMVTVGMKKERFIFRVETVGSLRPEEVVMSALDVLKNKLVEVDLTNTKEEETTDGGYDY